MAIILREYWIKFSQQKKTGKPIRKELSVHYEKGTPWNRIAFEAGFYILGCTFPGWMKLPDTMSIQYPIQIEISDVQVRRVFQLRETKSEIQAFFRESDKLFTVVDKETNNPVEIQRDMFTEFKSKAFTEIPVLLPNRRKSPEILTPMGGAGKRR